MEGENSHELDLKICISNCLREAEGAKLSSIAFPAISCGVFGGLPSVCVPLILEAVIEYFRETPSSGIDQV